VAEELNLSYAETLELLVLGVPLVRAFGDYSIPKILPWRRLTSHQSKSAVSLAFSVIRSWSCVPDARQLGSCSVGPGFELPIVGL
jgi:hypothetical protein